MKLARGWKKISISRGKEIIYDCKFSKVNAVRKGQSGAKSQEEICLKFSQAEGNMKAISGHTPDLSNQICVDWAQESLFNKPSNVSKRCQTSKS